MTRVRYNGKVLDVGAPLTHKEGQYVTLWEGLPENPEPYAEISIEKLRTLEKVHEEWCELPSSHKGSCQYYGDLPIGRAQKDLDRRMEDIKENMKMRSPIVVKTEEFKDMKFHVRTDFGYSKAPLIVFDSKGNLTPREYRYERSWWLGFWSDFLYGAVILWSLYMVYKVFAFILEG